MLFKEIIAVYSENHTKSININVVLLIVKADGTYGYLSDLKGLTNLCTWSVSFYGTEFRNNSLGRN
jgi:Cys-tRNA synthase (O-phospho-L-seryl-tRNA:Cys-tRNA synthase)